MFDLPSPQPRRTWFLAKRKASALLIVLAFVVLITFLVVAFLTRSQSDLMASSNNGKIIQTEGIARYGENLLITQLQSEIQQAMATSGTLSKVTVWPARSVVDDPANGGDTQNAGAISETDPRAFVAFRTSGTWANSDIYARAYGPSFPATLPPNLASTVRTDSGGHPFNNERWNVPKLLPYTPQQGSGWVNCPNWIYVTRSGARSPTATVPEFIASVANMKDSTSAGANFAIGRFAYIMYDVGGLIDANVAALSGVNFTPISTNPKFGEKGTSAFADLDFIFNAVPSGGTPAAFTNWRQNENVDFYLGMTGTTNQIGLIETGQLSVPQNSNIFFSRQDLIKFSQDNPAILRGGRSYLDQAGQDKDSGVLRYLRTWSRDSNAPTIPDAMVGSGVGGWRVASTALTIPFYRMEDCKRADYKIAKGEPVLARKFPLSRIRWFYTNCADTGEPSSTTQYDAKDAIKQHFGLVWVSNLGTSTPGSIEWQGVPGYMYTSPDGDTAATRILSLSEVAAKGREPDFFEWLKAGIDPNTLGVNAGMTASTVQLMQDQSTDFQVIQIGANIIDQADPDDVPTLILTKTATGAGTGGDRNGNPLVAMGVEDLPYMDELIVTLQRAGPYGTDGKSAAAGTIQAWIQPEIWMPHYNSSDRKQSARIGYNGAAFQQFRVRAVNGTAWVDAYFRQSGGSSSEMFNLEDTSRLQRTIQPRSFSGATSGDLLSNDSLQFSIADEDFTEPKIPGQSAAPNPYNNGVWNVSVRQVYAGPAPTQPGFKGIFGGQCTGAGIMASSTPYASRRYGLSDVGNLSCLMDPATGNAVTFPLGDHFFNLPTFILDSNRVTLNSPAGTPVPMTVVVEAQISSSQWVPIQIMENVSGLVGNDVNWEYTSAALGQGPLIRSGNPGAEISNTGTSGVEVAGFNASVACGVTQSLFGNKLCLSGTANGNGNQIPAYLSWCRPIIGGDNPDPLNNIYPIGAPGTRLPNDCTTDINRILATNGLLSGKTLAGTAHNGDPLFGTFLFGWSTWYNKFSFIKTDGRTRRFGQSGSNQGASGGSSIAPNPTVYLGTGAYPVLGSSTWDTTTLCSPGNSWWTATNPHSTGGGRTLPLWTERYSVGAGGVTPAPLLGDLIRNVASASASVYYRDNAADSAPRPADYAFSSTNSLPSYSTTDPVNASNITEIQRSRPVVLNRMFRSPAELGFVFRDIPWRSLDFFSPAKSDGTPTSGDTNLLNIFSIADGEYSAGGIDINKAPVPVLESLMFNTLEYPTKAELDGAGPHPALAAADFDPVISDLVAQNSYNATTPTSSVPLQSESDLVTALMKNSHVSPASGTLTNKSAVESHIRGLSGAMDTRTWNILIDLVAESGRLPSSATGLDQFVPFGQKRYFVFLAIDRITGRVLDRRIEPVNE